MTPLDIAALRAEADAKVAGSEPPEPCNRRCRARGECAFGRAEVAGAFCRAKPRDADRDEIRSRHGRSVGPPGPRPLQTGSTAAQSRAHR